MAKTLMAVLRSFSLSLANHGHPTKDAMANRVPVPCPAGEGRRVALPARLSESRSPNCPTSAPACAQSWSPRRNTVPSAPRSGHGSFFLPVHWCLSLWTLSRPLTHYLRYVERLEFGSVAGRPTVGV
jgi:hypothetical protein